MNQHNLYKTKLKKEKVSIVLIQILSVVVVFALWEILAKANLLDKFLFSCPSEIFSLLIANIKSNEIFILRIGGNQDSCLAPVASIGQTQFAL